jgi:hypothetical protein
MNKTDLIKKYEKNNPDIAKLIKRAAKKGVKQYAETFQRLAST